MDEQEKRNASFEQLQEDFRRNVMKCRHKLLDDFYIAYVAHLGIKREDFHVGDICLIEQDYCVDNKIGRKYWFEFKDDGALNG